MKRRLLPASGFPEHRKETRRSQILDPQDPVQQSGNCSVDSETEWSHAAAGAAEDIAEELSRTNHMARHMI